MATPRRMTLTKKKGATNLGKKIDGRARYWVFEGSKKAGKTIIFTVQYLGQCGCGFGRKVERKIEMKGSQTLDELHDAIIYKSFGWDDPHLYAFHMDNQPYSKNRGREYSCNPEPDHFTGEKANSTSIRLMDLNLGKNQKFLFIFDFGDDHYFHIQVSGFGEAEKGRKYPLVLEEKGKAPRQYR